MTQVFFPLFLFLFYLSSLGQAQAAQITGSIEQVKFSGAFNEIPSLSDFEICSRATYTSAKEERNKKTWEVKWYVGAQQYVSAFVKEAKSRNLNCEVGQHFGKRPSLSLGKLQKGNTFTVMTRFVVIYKMFQQTIDVLERITQ